MPGNNRGRVRVAGGWGGGAPTQDTGLLQASSRGTRSPRGLKRQEPRQPHHGSPQPPERLWAGQGRAQEGEGGTTVQGIPGCRAPC